MEKTEITDCAKKPRKRTEPVVTVCHGGAYTERQLAAEMQAMAYREGHRPTQFPLKNGGVAIAGITPAERRVLAVLEGEMTSNQVAIEIGGSNPGAFNLLKRLAAKGLATSRTEGRFRFWSKADAPATRNHTNEAQA